MKTLELGHTGTQVSSLCLGAMFFGTTTDKPMSYRVLDMYMDAGGSFIDTANIYAHWTKGGRGGESETLLGEWMRERGNRDRIFMASKVGFEYPGCDRVLRAREIEAECDKSLQRMGIDTIDLYYAHVDDRNTPLDETLEAFNRLVKAGKVRYIAASNFLAWRLEQARWISETNGWATFCGVQQRYTYLRLRAGANVAPQEMTNEDLLDYCRTTGMTLLAYGVLQGGAYTRTDRSFPSQFASADNNQRMAALRTLAEETGATVNQIILCWMMQSSLPVIPLIAASSEAQLQENLGALDVELSRSQIDRLDSAGLQ